jgi:1,4-alpha-glucan branching enzyme
LIYERKGKKISDRLIIAINLTPIPKEKVTIQLTNKRTLKERINTNDKKYWGNGTVFSEIQKGKIIDATRKIYEFEIFLPPLVAIVYQ